MESVQLTQFNHQVKHWPKSSAELDDLTEKISKLFDATFVVLISNQSRGSVGVRFADSIQDHQINREIFADYLRSQLKLVPNDSHQIKRVQISREGMPWQHLNSVQSIYFTRIQDHSPRGKKDFGTFIIGTHKPFPLKEEILYASIAQRLNDLAKIADLEDDIQIRNQFLSIASHELKTPLTSIYGILQLQERMLRLKKEQTPFPDQERHHHFLKMVIRQVERLNELIDGLLDVSRIQNGRFMVEPMDTDVATLLNDCTQTRLAVIAQEAGVKINVESIPKLIAWVDPVRIEEVMINLIMNAIRFSPEGGVVWVKLREDGGGFRITVRDQGPSIAAEDRERIFQPFERAQRTSRMGGLGLGLFISRQIAQLHGGNVTLIESIPGKGNVFEAYFPLRQAHLSTVSA